MGNTFLPAGAARSATAVLARRPMPMKPPRGFQERDASGLFEAARFAAAPMATTVKEEEAVMAGMADMFVMKTQTEVQQTWKRAE